MKPVTLEHSVEIDRPVEDVFAVVADPRNDAKWCPRVSDCEQRQGEAPAVGASYDVTHRPTLHRPHTRRIELIDFEPPTRVRSRQRDKVAEFTITYLLEARRGATVLTQRDDIRFRTPLHRLVGKPIIRRHMGDQLENLKRLLERKA